MGVDFRIKTSWFSSRKRGRLRGKFGADGEVALFRLWAYAAESRPSGELSGLSADDVAGEAHWVEGPPEAFVKALEKIGLLDWDGDCYAIHDWAEHNPWAAGANQRSAKAKAAASARWGGNGSNRGVETPQEEERREVREKKYSKEVQEVWTHYRAQHPKMPESLGSGRKEYKLIVERLADGYNVEALCSAIDGYHKSPWHCGENDRGKKFLALTLIMRDISHVQDGMDMADDTPVASTGGEVNKAWARVQQRCSGDKSVELTPMESAAVRSMGGLNSLGRMDAGKFASWGRKEFERIYATARQQGPAVVEVDKSKEVYAELANRMGTP